MNDGQILTTSIFDHPRVQSLLMGRVFFMELAGGVQALGRFLNHLEMNTSGGNSSLIERWKAQNAPAIISPNGAVQTTGPSAILSHQPVAPGSILRLRLSGPMMAEGDACTWGMNEFSDAIALANDNPNIEGILINADTPGGEIMAGQVLYNAIKASRKAVVVHADNLNSAGVYGTAAADEIIASGPASTIGSIGVYYPVNRAFLEFYKANMMDVYADESADKNAEFKALLEGDTGPLKQRASQYAKIFQGLVQQHRPLRGDVANTLSGGSFLGRDAVRRGLADGMGDAGYAMRRLQANIKKRAMQ